MDRTGLMKTTLLILLLVAAMTLFGAPATQAQNRTCDDVVVNTSNGEPTDPEEAVALLEGASFDTDFDTQVPTDEAEAESWFAALIDLLRQLGLIDAGDGESGS